MLLAMCDVVKDGADRFCTLALLLLALRPPMDWLPAGPVPDSIDCESLPALGPCAPPREASGADDTPLIPWRARCARCRFSGVVFAAIEAVSVADGGPGAFMPPVVGLVTNPSDATNTPPFDIPSGLYGAGLEGRANERGGMVYPARLLATEGA